MDGSMKARLLDTITSNEEHVRMRIFDGDLQISEAAAELLRIERAQHRREVEYLVGRIVALWKAANASKVQFG